MEEHIVNVTPTLIVYTLGVFFIGLATFIYDISKNRTITHLAPSTKNTWLDLGIFIWLVILVTFLAQKVGGILLPQITDPTWNKVFVGFLTQFATLLFLIACWIRYPKFLSLPISGKGISFPKTIGLGLYSFFAGFPLIWATGLVWKGVIKVWEQWNFTIETAPQELVALFTETNSVSFRVALFFFAMIIAPITEEVIFRGMIYRFLKSRIKPIYAITISALLFAAVHTHTLSFLPLFMLGILLARTYERYGSLKPSIAFHAIFNLNTLVLILLQG